ncbi:MAG TPA: universal stress protein [Rhodanobacteraceae bacterium]|nr:universal stress protein [Rhodanobacteraceae bacterium]
MKDILIYARDFQERTPAAYYGVRMAVGFGASVTGVYVCPAPMYFAPAVEPGLISTVLENARQYFKEAVQARKSFLDWAASMGVAHAEWVVVEGDVTDAMVQASTRHDLLVLDHAKGSEGGSWDIPGLVLRAGVPCIVLPQRGSRYDEIARVAIGWNGSPEAMRAVHSALPFLQGREVLLLRGEEREKYPGLEWEPPFNVVEYLGRHGAHVEQRTIDAKRDDAGGALLEEALEFQADLFVMGAYGRSRFSEWMLGGVTRYALTWAGMPLFMQH